MTVLIASTTVSDKRGNAVFLPAGSELPDWAAEQVGDHLLGRSPETIPVVEEHLEAPVPDEPELPDRIIDTPELSAPPPRRGPGSSATVWLRYAADNNVIVDRSSSRDKVIAALEAAGVPTSKE